MKYEIMQVCAKALYAPIPTMIWEVTMNITKLAALSKFPRMFLCIKIYAQNTFKPYVDLTSSWSDGRVCQYMNQEKLNLYDEKTHWNLENIRYLGGGGGRGSARSTKKNCECWSFFYVPSPPW